MDGDGIKQAFCLLKWRASGGAFDIDGHPILPKIHSNQEDAIIIGYCTRAYDCFTCEFMQQELSYYNAAHVTWACPACVMRLKSRRDGVGEALTLAGHYTEGECQVIRCRREDRHSPLLQLVLGDIKEDS